MQVSLISVTPHAEQIILKCARVSSDDPNNTNTGLIRYLMSHEHWSPFEMAHMVIEIHCSRTISRQILRHRSFSFQEFSQRYKQPDSNTFEAWETRVEHKKNRQSSVETDDVELHEHFLNAQSKVYEYTTKMYQECLDKGVAKEQARCLLAEGLTESRLYMSGTIRSFIHYVELRTKHDTQKEHRMIAEKVKEILIDCCPTIGEILK